MRLLLDTHVFLWAQDAPKRLGVSFDILADPDNDRFLSVASAWEIAIKWSTGKLVLSEPPARYVPSRLSSLAGSPLAVTMEHALAVAELPRLHADPFDRVLVAQAQLLDLTIVTADPAVAQYEVDSILI